MDKRETFKKILLIDKRLAKSSYTLRTLVGFYLIYIDYNIWRGLREPDVVNTALVVAGGVFFAVVSVLCIISGAYGLYNKEYYEEARSQGAEEDVGSPDEEPAAGEIAPGDLEAGKDSSESPAAKEDVPGGPSA